MLLAYGPDYRSHRKTKTLLPKKLSAIQANGNVNPGIYLASFGDELGQLLLDLIASKNLNVLSTGQDTEGMIQGNQEEKAINNQPVPFTHRAN
jgi:hypothetical protein